jgi:hypothetical protein
MSDTQQGPTWWRASDGKWYPPGQYPELEGPPNPRDAQPGKGSARRRRKPYWWAPEAQSTPPRPRPTRSRRVALWVTLIALLVVVLVAAGASCSRKGRPHATPARCCDASRRTCRRLAAVDCH